jgi:hypothetical protein
MTAKKLLEDYGIEDLEELENALAYWNDRDTDYNDRQEPLCGLLRQKHLYIKGRHKRIEDFTIECSKGCTIIHTEGTSLCVRDYGKTWAFTEEELEDDD